MKLCRSQSVPFSPANYSSILPGIYPKVLLPEQGLFWGTAIMAQKLNLDPGSLSGTVHELLKKYVTPVVPTYNILTKQSQPVLYAEGREELQYNYSIANKTKSICSIPVTLFL